MGLEPTISCLGSKRSTTELHPLAVSHRRATVHGTNGEGDYKSRFSIEQLVRQIGQRLTRLAVWVCLLQRIQRLIG